MNNRRDIMILVGLFLLLTLFVLFKPNDDQDTSQPTIPTTYSTGPEGTAALLRWLQALGFDAQRLEYRTFTLSERDAVLFVFDPSEPFNRTEAAEVLRWVESGGTLVVVSSQPGLFNGAAALLRELDVETRPVSGDETLIERTTSAQPFFDRPPLGQIEVQASRALDIQNQDYAQLLGPHDNPLLIGMKREAGYVYIATTMYPFTNEGLRTTANVALPLNLIQRLPSQGRILFDEYHHGYFDPPSLRSIILAQPWGWGLIFGLGAIAAYLVLTGRRFGKPVPLREEVMLRTSGEYVESMADLFQRSGKREYIGLHYHTALKRRLARPFGINPRLEDDQFLRELSRYRTLDEPQIQSILEQLRRRGLREEQLMQTLSAADAIAER